MKAQPCHVSSYVYVQIGRRRVTPSGRLLRGEGRLSERLRQRKTATKPSIFGGELRYYASFIAIRKNPSESISGESPIKRISCPTRWSDLGPPRGGFRSRWLTRLGLWEDVRCVSEMASYCSGKYEMSLVSAAMPDGMGILSTNFRRFEWAWEI